MSRKTIIIISIVAVIAVIIGIWYYRKNRTIKFYHVSNEIDLMSHEELVNAVSDMSAWETGWAQTAMQTNIDEFNTWSDELLRKCLRDEIQNLMDYAYSGK